MRLNKSTGHAIRILIECARANGELVKVADLATTLDLTMQNVFKIVHILSRNRLVSAARGRNGGVGLAKPADQIRMGDIVRAMESTEIELDIDTPHNKSTSDDVSGVNRVLDDALVAFVTVLDQHTLADMAGQRHDFGRRSASKPTKKRTSKTPHSGTPTRTSSGRAAARSGGN